MTHANTPAIDIIHPRGRSVRHVGYHRREGVASSESCVTQHLHDAVGRTVLSRDPRLFDLHQQGRPVVSQIDVFSLTGAQLLSENNDAGWRLGLFGEDRQGCEGWDSQLSHSRVQHDVQRRPAATFENAHGEPERCTARFSYADASADATRNRRGQLLRHDDTAGTLRFIDYGLAGTLLEHSRTFTEDPHWPVDWPMAENERDAVLETEPAVTRIQCNAACEPIRQTDAKGNVQTFIQTRATELKEVRLALAGQTRDTVLVSDIQYNAFGQIERQCAGNGVISCAMFRPEDGRLEKLKAYVPGQPALQDLNYEYDAAGNITCLTDAAHPVRYHRNQRIEPSNRYRYDSLYRLIEASGRQLNNAPGGPQLPEFQSDVDPSQLENYTRLYRYDKAGNLEVMQHRAASANRTERTAIAASSNRSLPEKADGELPDENEIAAGHDLNGNRKYLLPRQSLLWDLRNQLRQVDQVVREDGPDDIEFYLYDGSGQRLRKIRQAYSGTLLRTHETRYLPGVETRKSAGEILHVITVKAGRGTIQVLHFEKKPASDIPQDQVRYTFTDHQNSSTLELDESAGLITWELYYPYGGICWWAGRNKLEASYKTLRYSGQERDATGLYYYGFRYYMPWCQQWLSADPAGIADGLNLYAMVHGNPVGHIDISGLADDHPPGQLRDAATSAFARDFISRGLGGVAQMATVAALSTLTPSHATNAALQATAGVLDGLAVGMVGGGLAARLHRNAMAIGAVSGLLIGVSPAVWSGERGETEEIELNQIAIDRIGAAAGSIVREISQQVLRGHGSNFPWGSVHVRDRLPTVSRTTAAYAFFTGLNGAFAQFVPESVRSWISPLVEGADGAVGTWLRGLHPETSYSGGSASLQSPPLADTVYGAAGRITGSEYSFGINRMVEAVAEGMTGLPPAERTAAARMVCGGITGILSSLTEFRGPIMQTAQSGYHQFNPQIVSTISADVQTTDPRFASRRPSRRHSFSNL